MKRIFILFLFVTTIFVVSCDSKDVFDEDGLTSIYMPQASMLNGGFSNVYPVPFENGNIENYALDANTKQMKVVLGVKNSGRSKNGFSVNVVADLEKTKSVVENQQVENSVQLPEGTYALPQSVSVASESNEKSFFLEVNVQKIIDEYPEYFEKKMVLAVKITGNDNINSALATTLVVIDGAKFLPTPPPPPIETMLDSNAWKILPQNVGGPTGAATINVIDGNIHYSNGTDYGKFNHVIYQPVQVVAGETYSYDMIVDIKGKAWGWIELYISEQEPIANEDFQDNKVYEISSVTSPMNGLMSEFSIIQNKKTYTATKNGVIYFIIKVGSWDNNFEQVTLSDIVFKKSDVVPTPPPASDTTLKDDAWKTLPQDVGGTPTGSAEITIANGTIQYSNGTTDGMFNHVIYQALQVEAGKTYTYDMKLDISGKASGWIQVYVSQYEPVSGEDFRDNKVFDIANTVTSPMSGLMSELSEIQDKKEFTPTQSGTIYFIIKIGSWGNNFESVKLSDLFFKEKS